jgi:RNA polymerase sigma-70 factor (ECF subfamily)
MTTQDKFFPKFWMPAYTLPVNDERSVLDGLRQLDPQVIGAVYDHYFPEVYRFVLYRLGDESLAEDIASEVFIRLLEAVKKRRGPKSSLRGWLLSTASHAVSDHLRRLYRHPTEALPETIPDLDSAPMLEFDDRERKRVLRTAMAQLTPDQQNVLALRFGEGYSLEETASAMRKNVNAVKALQFRALAALQRNMSEVAVE